MNIIEAEKVTKQFTPKVTALRNVSVKIEPGEFIAIIGLSGAGKSTFLRSINGTLTPSSGKMSVMGNDLCELSNKERVKIRKKIGFIFQQFNLVKQLSAIDNVLTGRIGYNPLWRSLTGLYSQDDINLATYYLREVGLSDKIEQKVDQLSGGQQQRVMASLDPKLSEVVLKLLQKFNKDRGITVLVNIHVLELAKRYARRILAFKKGELVYDGSIADLTDKEIENIYKIDEKELLQ
jgi:phosphonate transport system ATP-binding protein